MSTPVIGTCPICSGLIELVHTETKDATESIDWIYKEQRIALSILKQ